VRLIGADGSQFGVVTLDEARAAAAGQGLDLVEVAPTADPPVCRVMDFGRYRYEQEQRDRKSKKSRAASHLKEMKLRPKIDIHDYRTKRKHIERFLRAGSKVKITIMFRGREMVHTELGLRLLKRVAEELVELGSVESPPKLDGRNMIMVMTPSRNPDAVVHESGGGPLAQVDHSQVPVEVAAPTDAAAAAVAEDPATVEVAAAEVAALAEAPVEEPAAAEPAAEEPAAAPAPKAKATKATKAKAAN